MIVEAIMKMLLKHNRLLAIWSEGIDDLLIAESEDQTKQILNEFVIQLPHRRYCTNFY